MARYKLSLHIFRRDLRLIDNTALIEALQLSERVMACFIYDSRQLFENSYRSDNALRFMEASLADLKEQLHDKNGKLYFFAGIPHEEVEKIISNLQIDAVFLNSDYTEFSQKRDSQIEQVCQKNKVAFHAVSDTLLNEPGAVLKDDKTPYTVFTPFLRKSKTKEVKSVSINEYRNYYKASIKTEVPDNYLKKVIPPHKSLLFLKGGRTEALDLLNKLADLKDYEISRNFPAEEGTSKLSAHLKFGTVSVREVYRKITKEFDMNHSLITELYWRDFFTHIAFHFPKVFGQSFHAAYDKIEWENDLKKFEAWHLGKTGFPIIDAGMRQLNTTGWMHNRLRMITASFLVKDLHIDWRWGEKYFAQKLIDIDPAVNNGNWQWAASTGCDAQPWFRIFNPWLQQKRYDPNCIYIKKWIPELKSYPIVQIHNWFKKTSSESLYSLPIVDHNLASKTTKELFAAIKQKTV